MRVFVACEFSGVVRDAFAARGHDAMSCDLLESERLGHHIVGDVFDALYATGPWDLLIGHPPCTRLCNSGVRWLAERNLWASMRDAARFFAALLSCPVPRIAIENPIPHRYAAAEIGRRYDQIVHPYMFGHGETKATCLWLVGLPKLSPSNLVRGRLGRCWRESPGPDRWKRRSRTFSGLAEAMADQWG